MFGGEVSMAGYTRLFGTILTSTIWMEDADTRIVWITMLAMSDANGYVGASVPGLARIAGVPRESAESALTKFLLPDPDSRTREHEGRRIVEADGGWVLLNHAKYRDIRDAENRREQTRLAVQRHRAKKKAREPVPPPGPPPFATSPLGDDPDDY